MSEEPRFTVTMERIEGLEFRVRFDWDGVEPLTLDEPEPLGAQKGPNASRLVAAAVGNCLTASLLFCLQKSRVDVKGTRTTIEGRMARNEQKRMRIGGFGVTITVDTDEDPQKLERCLSLFEDYCVVTQSVRSGIPVEVEVVDAAGKRLMRSEAE